MINFGSCYWQVGELIECEISWGPWDVERLWPDFTKCLCRGHRMKLSYNGTKPYDALFFFETPCMFCTYINIRASASQGLNLEAKWISTCHLNVFEDRSLSLLYCGQIMFSLVQTFSPKQKSWTKVEQQNNSQKGKHLDS